VIDTDCGVDDAVALWFALEHPGLEVVAVTSVFGNGSAATAAQNVHRILHAAGRDDVPIALGAEAPMGDAPSLRHPDFIHGTDGVGNTHRPMPPGFGVVAESAAELLARIVRERPGELTVITLGPLTNLGEVIRADPAWARDVADLVVMGGSVTRGGNALPLAEANVAHDPDAAAEVVAADWTRPPLLVALDVTHDATLTAHEFELLARRRTPAAEYLDEPLHFYRRFGSTFTLPDCPCHDLTATIAAADDELVTDAPVLPLAIQTGPGPAWGATVVDRRVLAFSQVEGSLQEAPPGFSPWRIASGIDVARFRGHVRTLFGDAPAAPPE
jgi:purine nucleosidase